MLSTNLFEFKGSRTGVSRYFLIFFHKRLSRWRGGLPGLSPLWDAGRLEEVEKDIPALLDRDAQLVQGGLAPGWGVGHNNQLVGIAAHRMLFNASRWSEFDSPSARRWYPFGDNFCPNRNKIYAKFQWILQWAKNYFKNLTLVFI